MNELEPTESTFGELAAATDRLLTDLGALGDLSAPSRLPGWSRAHVLSHLAAQVPALERLLEWARTGVETPQYADRRARDAEIEAGAHRPAADLLAHVADTAVRFLRTVEDLPAPAWNATIRPFTGELCTPRRILVIRLRELELHHVDLAVGYEIADIPESARDILLGDVLGYYAAADAVPDFTLHDGGGSELARFGSGTGRLVSGEPADALAWLAGRADGARLRTTGGELPVLPSWI